jgi:hypothetical protein
MVVNYPNLSAEEIVLTPALNPAFSPREKEKRSQCFAADLRLEWLKRFEQIKSSPRFVLSLGRGNR